MLSVVIIAKNEAHNLPRCLESVKDLADEMVVVDSGSTDGTLEVCVRHGATVHQREFTTYADQKNWAADQASQPYVLSLDADESLGDDLFKELLAWKTRVASADECPFDAWSMPRLTSYLGMWVRHGGWYPDRKIRLWCQGTGSWKPAHQGGMLHEAWEPNVPSRVAKFEGDLHHHSYHRSCAMRANATCVQPGGDEHGVVHAVVGAAGYTFSDVAQGADVPAWVAFANDTRYGFATIEASDSELRWQFLRSDDGSVLDEFTLTKSNATATTTAALPTTHEL